MGIDDFNNLKRYEKLSILKMYGVELNRKFTKYGTIKLVICVAIKNFFVELNFNVMTKQIENIFAFEDGEILNNHSNFNEYLINTKGFDDKFEFTY
ncbi:hypothetical protein AAFP94_01010 [Flavobacteriaceae bacterium MJ-SS4]|uniref:hypothetical protein n=1 Tax=Gilvirhabdus luticola TaxID=3079858 RepID=UPI0032DCDB18